MSFSLRMEGLDKLGEHQDEIVEALRKLDDRIDSVRFDPNDEGGVDSAIRAVSDEVDRRLLPFQANSIVQELIGQIKAKAAQNIRFRAEQLRKEKDGAERSL